MPELPEVEIVRRGLELVLAGERIARVEQRRKDLRFPFPEGFVRRLEGRKVLSLDRRAKYLLARLDSAEVLVMHLGMSGRFTIESARNGPPRLLGDYEYGTDGDSKHDHVVIRTKRGATVTYNDPRRFGFMLLVPESEIDTHPLFASLGVEPLGNGLASTYLAAQAQGRRCDLKAFLMDQHVVAGLGNIYVCEALHRAFLSPMRAARTLAKRNGTPADSAERLVVEIRRVLQAAIVAGGSTLKDYRQADGSKGDFQSKFAVYGREGEPCSRPGCGGTVQRRVQAGRATFFCKACQK